MQNKGLLQLYVSNTDLKLVLSWEWHRQPSRVTIGVQLLEEDSRDVLQWYSWADLIARGLAGVEPFLPFPLLVLCLARRFHASLPPCLPVLLMLSLGAALLQQLNLITWQQVFCFVRLVLCWVGKWNRHGERSKEQQSSTRDRAEVRSQAMEARGEGMLLVLARSSWAAVLSSSSPCRTPLRLAAGNNEVIPMHSFT